jgi:hypothetical protein
MSLRECMEKHTEREMKITLAWLEMQWDHPNRTIKFKFDRKCPAPATTPEQQMMISKQCWLGAAGLLGKVKL